MLLRVVMSMLVLAAVSACGDKPELQAESPFDWTISPLPPDETSAGATSWRLAARAETIVVGKLVVDDAAMAAFAERKKEYVPIKLAVSRPLKGADAGSVLLVSHYAATRYGPGPETIASMRDQVVIAWLIHAAEAPHGPYYFVRDNALVPWRADTETATAAEIAAQDLLRGRVFAHFARHKPPHDESVARIVARLLVKETAASAKRELVALGADAAPALVKHMDDRRRLASPGISLSLPGAFEGLTHYGPVAVVDILSIALVGLAREDTGAVYNGGSEVARRLAVEGGQVWLGKALRL